MAPDAVLPAFSTFLHHAATRLIAENPSVIVLFSFCVAIHSLQWATVPTEVTKQSAIDEEAKAKHVGRVEATKEQRPGILGRLSGQWEPVKRFQILLPLLWPDSLWDKIDCVLMGGCLILQSSLLADRPRRYGIAIHRLESVSTVQADALQAVFVWLLVNWLHDRFSCWADVLSDRIQRGVRDRTEILALRHVMSLSGNDSGRSKEMDIETTIAQACCLAKLLDYVVFKAFPLLVNLVVATRIFACQLGSSHAGTLLAFAVSYVWIKSRGITSHNRYQTERSAAARKKSNGLRETLQQKEPISDHDRQEDELRRYKHTLGDHSESRHLSVVQQSTQAMHEQFLCLSIIFAQTFLLIDASAFATYITLLRDVFGMLGQINWLVRGISDSIIECAQLIDLLSIERSITDMENAPELQCEGEVLSCENVGKEQVLHDVTFEVHPGEIAVLVGGSGAGKTTLMNLIHRSRNLDHGNIKIGNQETRNVSLRSLRDNIGIVRQKRELFDGRTIMENITLAKPDASAEDVVNACKVAQIHEKIEALPEKYHTKVGAQGVQLSQGELDRVAIARWVLKRPRILLMDEPFSSLDPKTAASLWQALKETRRPEYITVITSHHLPITKDADRILVLDKGRLVERGTHDKLMEDKGHYFHLWQNQLERSQI